MSKETEIVKLLESGLFTHQEIADTVGVTRARVTQLNPNKKPRVMTTLSFREWEYIIDQHLFGGVSISKLAKEFEVSRTAIYNKLKEYEEKKTGKPQIS